MTDWTAPPPAEAICAVLDGDTGAMFVAMRRGLAGES
jgi:hypothetical protein